MREESIELVKKIVVAELTDAIKNSLESESIDISVLKDEDNDESTRVLIGNYIQDVITAIDDEISSFSDHFIDEIELNDTLDVITKAADGHIIEDASDDDSDEDYWITGV